MLRKGPWVQIAHNIDFYHGFWSNNCVVAVLTIITLFASGLDGDGTCDAVDGSGFKSCGGMGFLLTMDQMSPSMIWTGPNVPQRRYFHPFYTRSLQ